MNTTPLLRIAALLFPLGFVACSSEPQAGGDGNIDGSSDGGSVGDGGEAGDGGDGGDSGDSGDSGDGGAETPAAPAYSDDSVMVTLYDPGQGDALAAEHGSVVRRGVGPAGVTVLALSSTMNIPDFLDALADDPRVADAARIGRITGSSPDYAGHGGRYVPYQWHFEAVELPSAERQPALDDVVVAVLDTGVAYIDRDVDGVTHTAADSLRMVPIVAPWDFVNDDDHPGDDHQHGTHIASLIASNGDFEGIAPGVGLMPIKVLDETSSGWEVDLLDGLRHAIDNDADVINLSLAFAPGYAPSPQLRDLLEEAAEAGIIVVAATGNDGLTTLPWPAASPTVVAVGSAVSGWGMRQPLRAAGYSNLHPGVDILAPGGDMGRDDNADGLPDGLLAETIAPGDPSRVGGWFMAGTSQAAALVSGAAAQYLAGGHDPALFAPWLHLGAGKGTPTSREASAIDTVAAGFGAGHLRISKSDLHHRQAARFTEWSFGAAVLPWLQDNGDGTVTPMARVVELDARADDLSSLGVLVGRFDGSSQASFSCKPDGHTCVIAGPAVDAWTSDGEPAALQWTISVDAATRQGMIFRPSTAIASAPLLDAVVATLDDAGATRTALGIYWEAGQDPTLGSLAEAWAVPALGSGLASSPLGTLFTPAVLEGRVSSRELMLTAPTGSIDRLLLADVDGSGLSSSPMGGVRGRFSMLQGSGLSSSPMGGFAMDLFMPDASRDAVLFMWDGENVGGDVGERVLAWHAQGGAITQDGYTGAELMVGTGLVTLGAGPSEGSSDGAGAAAWSP